MHRLKQTSLVLIKIAFTLALFWFLLKKVDIKAAWEAAKTISPVMLAIALLLEIMQVAIIAYRWKFVVHSIGAQISFLRALEIVFVGTFFGQVLPGAVGGDAVRIWMTRQGGLSTSASINSVLLERIATVLGLVLLVMATVPFIPLSDHMPFSRWIFPALSLAMIIGIGVLMLLDKFPVFLDRWMIAHHFFSLAQDTRRLFLHPGRAFWIMAVAVIGHVNLCLMVWILALGLGIPLSVLHSLVLVPPVVLLATLPISIAGWGVREVAMVAAFSLVGIPDTKSLVISVLFGLVGVIMSLPGSVLWMRAKHKAAPEVRTAS